MRKLWLIRVFLLVSGMLLYSFCDELVERIHEYRNPEYQRRANQTEVILRRASDFVILLDASKSIDANGWMAQIEFARGIAVQLAEASIRQGVPLRLALGQFSSSVNIHQELTTDVASTYANLTTWQCNKATEEACHSDPERVACVLDLTCIPRLRGYKDVGVALCGPQQPNGSVERCRGGAMGVFHRGTSDMTPAEECLGIGCAQRAVIIVTDDKPMIADVLPREHVAEPMQRIRATRSAFVASRSVKNAVPPVRVFAVQVGGKTRDGTLAAVSSCCGADRMQISSASLVSVECAKRVRSDCPYHIMVDDFKLLRESVERLLLSIALVQAVASDLDVFLSTLGSRSAYPSKLLWLLLLPLPSLAISLYNAAFSRKKAGFVGSSVSARSPRADGQEDQSDQSKLSRPGVVPPIQNFARAMRPPSGEVASDLPFLATEPQLFQPPVPSGEQEQQEVSEPRDCELATQYVEAKPAHDESPAPASGAGPADLKAKTAGYCGRRWFSLRRQSFIVGGKPVNVDYGAQAPAPASAGQSLGIELTAHDSTADNALDPRSRVREATTCHSFLRSSLNAKSVSPEQLERSQTLLDSSASVVPAIAGFELGQKLRGISPAVALTWAMVPVVIYEMSR
eukprot:TRINITY_DN71707_c0_g1_i1.p1 TRINITY_DN71707_c0_g1~~TRINITY_DN71707_c0_g1_i1.p1  ORF type:complete len:628 (+),score=70.75 TRINITY_DN71707_c0_g1_i1:79-1962(+)